MPSAAQHAELVPLVPDCSITSDEVEYGRPAPDMVPRTMESLRITDPKDVLTVGDTIPDVGSALPSRSHPS